MSKAEYLRKVYDHIKAKHDAVPDPDMEPIPRVREELQVHRDELRRFSYDVWSVMGNVANRERRLNRFAKVKKVLEERVSRQLVHELEPAQARMNAIRAKSNHSPDWRDDENIVNESLALLDYINEGSDDPFRTGIPRKVAALIGDEFDLMDFRPLSFCNRVIAEEREAIADVLKRIQSLIDEYEDVQGAA
ncbi:MAG: hypothetical protein K8J08_16905 [Thermoanaerobaculia bacterium]|nr:hypothetical protein [Thermoanaerobaculia bacterium]